MKFGTRSNTYLTQNKKQTIKKQGHSISPIPFDRTVLSRFANWPTCMDSERALLKDSF